MKDAPDEWRIRCQGCTYSAGSGTSRIESELNSARHRMRYPAHTVRLYNGFQHVASYPDREQIVTESLPGFGPDAA